MKWGPGPYPLTRSRLLCCCSGSGALGFIRFVVGYVTTVILPHQIDRNGVQISNSIRYQKWTQDPDITYFAVYYDDIVLLLNLV